LDSQSFYFFYKTISCNKEGYRKTLSEGSKLDEIKKEIERFYPKKKKNLIWGATLASNRIFNGI